MSISQFFCLVLFFAVVGVAMTRCGVMLICAEGVGAPKYAHFSLGSRRWRTLVSPRVRGSNTQKRKTNFSSLKLLLKIFSCYGKFSAWRSSFCQSSWISLLAGTCRRNVWSSRQNAIQRVFLRHLWSVSNSNPPFLSCVKHIVYINVYINGLNIDPRHVTRI